MFSGFMSECQILFSDNKITALINLIVMNQISFSSHLLNLVFFLYSTQLASVPYPSSN